MTTKRLHPLQPAPFHFDSQAQKLTGKYRFLQDRARLVVTIVSPPAPGLHPICRRCRGRWAEMGLSTASLFPHSAGMIVNSPSDGDNADLPRGGITGVP